MSSAYYNEIEPFAAQWLRNLSNAGHIARGRVDDRSIKDVQPRDLDGFTQCHFFAGIGVWSYALRLAGWPDDREVWTGSCPCQPFSAAGKRGGFSDERHLWPSWFRLICERRPAVIFGEQVSGTGGRQWFDLVSTDLEKENYAIGAIDLCAAGVGAPHIRQRLFWVAYSLSARRAEGRTFSGCGQTAGSGCSCRLGDSPDARFSGSQNAGADCCSQSSGTETGERRASGLQQLERTGASRGLVNSDEERCGSRGSGAGAPQIRDGSAIAGCREAGGLADADGAGLQWSGPPQPAERRRSSELAGASTACRMFWGGAEWVYCTDEKWRSVEPGSFPLAHGAASRVGRLRAYGNAIVAQAAATFIRAAIPLIGVET